MSTAETTQADTPVLESYEQIPYPLMTHAKVHPRVLEAVGTMFGMTPPDVTRCRVLELGCASGTNLIPEAQDLPDSEFVGMDDSQHQIEAAQQSATELGLSNIELRTANILDIDATWGEFDYIVCHGVHSWVSPEVQQKILSICKQNLAPNGIAVVSYNTYPGWHSRGLIREMMMFHADLFKDPRKKISQARAFLDLMVESTNSDTPHGRMLQREMETVRRVGDGYLYHEYLEDENHPVYFKDFIASAEAEGLQYLGESDVQTMMTVLLPPKVREFLAQAPLLRQEQYMDFFRNRPFRVTLLCHGGIELRRHVDRQAIDDLYFTTTKKPEVENCDLGGLDPASFKIGGRHLKVSVSLAKAAMLHMAENWPQAFSITELHIAASQKLGKSGKRRRGRQTIVNMLLTAITGGALNMYVHPPRFASNVSEHPVTTPLARLQASKDLAVTTLRHEMKGLATLPRHVLQLLDGQHDREAIIDSVRAAMDSGKLVVKAGGDVARLRAEDVPGMVDKTLADMQQAALLVS